MKTLYKTRNMKKLLLLLLLFTGIANAQIVNIPDANFKSRLISLGTDLNNDNEIQVSEASTIFHLDISNEFGNYPIIEDLTGLETFTNLISLDFQRNQISTLDISSLINLQSIDCSFNSITNLNVTNLTNLLSLNCSGNPIVTLNLSNNLMLQSITCGSRLGTTPFLNTLIFPFPINDIREITVYQTNLTNMNLLNFPLLTAFAWHNNGVDTFDFSNSTLLTSLSLGGTFTSLDLTPLINLKSINLALENNIPLDFSTLTALDHFSIGSTSTLFTNLNLNNSPLLEFLAIQGTSISTLTIENCQLLDYIFLNQVNGINSLDLSGLQNLQWVHLKDMVMSNLNLKNGTLLDGATFQSTNISHICCNTLDIQLLNNALNYPDSNNFISNVNSYCSFTPGGDYNTITGAATFDADTNGCDASDTLIPNMKFNLTDGANEGATFTNASGNYKFYTETGNFELTPNVENPTFFNFSPTSATINFADSNNNITTQNFCISPVGIHPDLEVILAPITPARPGFDATYKLVYRNKGNQTLSQSYGVNFFFNQNLMEFVSSSTIPTSAGPGGLSWSYTNLLPFESRSIEITLNINSPTETNPVNIDDILQFTTSILPMAGDETTSDNTFLYNQTVVGSFDPNDITCIEGETVAPSEIGKYLHYLVNFENTGTYVAENVVVKDVIDTTKYDINSLQLLSTSDDAYTRITGNIIEFIFENINLEAKTGNPPVGGHGNVLFKIKSKNNLVTGDFVSKSASIFFDYNAPISTNVEQTTFTSLSNSIFEIDDLVSIYPNPTSSKININSNFNIKSIELYDVQGRVLVTQIGNSKSLDISDKTNGIYFLKITTEKGSKVEKLVKK